jgi:hypothetical protein
MLIFCSQERSPIEEVFEQLKCSREGLTSDEGATRLQVFGPNKLEEKKVNFCNLQFISESKNGRKMY